MHIECSPAKKITLLTATRRVKFKLAEDGETVTEAEFKILDTDGIFRIRVEDEKGKCAWSQYYEV